MKKYEVTAYRSSGRTMSRTLQGASKEAVRKRLEAQGWRVTHIEEKEKNSLCFVFKRQHRFSRGQLGRLFQELAAMTDAGIPLADSWRLLAKERADSPEKDFYLHVLEGMENGSSLSELLENSGLFPPLAWRILRAGEHSGNLEMMLQVLGDYYTSADKQRKQIVQTLFYPTFLLACTLLVLTGAILYILPVFEKLFEQLHVPLPALTQTLIRVGFFLRHHQVICLLGLILSVLFGCFVQRQQTVRETVIQQILQVPWLRRICLIFCWQRFSKVLAVQLAGGISMLPAIHDAASVVPLAWFRKKMEHCSKHLRQGQAFSAVVQREEVATPYVETMLAIGEVTGNYDAVFTKISQYYSWRLHLWLAPMKKLLEPVVMTIVGLIIGFVVLALLLPILDAAAGLM